MNESFLYLLTFVNVLVLILTVGVYLFNSKQIDNNPVVHEQILNNINLVPQFTPTIDQNPISSFEKESEICDDPIWCNIEMPKISYFRFDPPTDSAKWHKAKLAASKGEQVLLKEVVKAFPNHLDFLDGDISFRSLHYMMDMFLDLKRDMRELIKPTLSSSDNMKSVKVPKRVSNPDPKAPTELIEHRKLAVKTKKYENAEPEVVNGEFKYPWEKDGKVVVPPSYDFKTGQRAPIISIGYMAFQGGGGGTFNGKFFGGAFLSITQFMDKWKQVKDKIETPLIGIISWNENWGFLSSHFPNRTAKWGRCCDTPKYSGLQEFLDHPKTLMLVVNQHTNISHPKIMVLPRGIPIQWGYTRMIVWDSMRIAINNVKKSQLLFAASSSWGPRPQILSCISKKFKKSEFTGHIANGPQQRYGRNDYYFNLAKSMFGLGLPGLGYDTFRAWEILTMGSILVIERGVGFDRSLWKLPAILLDDFADLTPDMLRVAYIEAIYRAKDFEFKRLTQSFWWSAILNVSSSMSTQPLLDLFPMEAEDPNFTRPFVPYECGKTNTCGAGTKRIPKKSC